MRRSMIAGVAVLTATLLSGCGGEIPYTPQGGCRLTESATDFKGNDWSVDWCEGQYGNSGFRVTRKGPDGPCTEEVRVDDARTASFCGLPREGDPRRKSGRVEHG